MRGMIVRSVGLCCIMLAALNASYAAGDGAKAQQEGTPLPTDWSHRHVVFSRPTTTEQVVRTQRDFRYQLQRRTHEIRPMAKLRVGDERRLPPRLRRRKLHPDWAFDLGPNATVGAGRYPAKFAFESNVANCVAGGNPDFVVYGTGVPGVSGPSGQGNASRGVNRWMAGHGQLGRRT
jgi:hypothetical protein